MPRDDSPPSKTRCTSPTLRRNVTSPAKDSSASVIHVEEIEDGDVWDEPDMMEVEVIDPDLLKRIPANIKKIYNWE